MIRFEPFPITISGNNRDDLLYELWQYEKMDNPDALKAANLDQIERRPAVGPKAEAYEKEIFEALLRIGKNRTGRQVLAATFSVPADIFILPVGERDKVMLGGHFSNCLADHAHISATNPNDKVPPIKITPRDVNACGSSKLSATETTLVHELVHAARPREQVLSKSVTGDKWTSLEEFFAVVVENIYRSERGDALLRGGHDDSILPEGQRTSAGFLKDRTLRTRVQTIYQREPLARAVSRFGDIKFNPFALIAGL